MLRLEHAFGARNRSAARIPFASHADGFRNRFEYGFGNVVTVAAVVQYDMQIAVRIRGERLPKVLDQLAVKTPNLGRPNRCAILKRVPIGPARAVRNFLGTPRHTDSLRRLHIECGPCLPGS